jgi:hypothetical protein
MASPIAAAPAAAPHPLSGLFRPEILLPVLVILGYVSFVITGFGAGLGALQPLPIYLFASVLLLLLQLYLFSFRTLPRSLYGIGAAIFGLVFAAEASFFPKSPSNFTRAPFTYIIVNIIAVIIFAVDAVQRHTTTTDPTQPGQANVSLRFYRTLATDFAGLAILFGLSSFLLDFINTRSALHFLGIGAPTKPISVDLNQIFGLSLPATIQHLEGLNLALAFATGVIWLLLIVIIGGLTSLNNQSAPTTGQPATQVPAFLRLLQAFGSIFQRGSVEAIYSLRSVLQIFLWLIPAFSIANFATVSTGYFNASAQGHVGIGELFNPLSASSLANIGRGIDDLVLAVVALGAVVLTVAVAEFNANVIRNTLQQVGSFVRIVSLTLFIFTLALAMTNAVTKLFNIDQATPFQVGAATGVALVLFAVNALVSSITDRPKTTKQPTTTPAPVG